MSNFLAIATVTAALRRTIQAAISIDVPGAQATTVRPDGPNSGVPNPGVNIYLYQVMPNAALRNYDLPVRRSDGTLTSRPQVALDLHYLLSFYGDETDLEPQRLLGSVLGTLHAQPVLSRSAIQSAINDLSFLSGSDLADEVEMVRFTPVALNLEELSRLWSVLLQVSYTLSVVYQASVVLISAEAAPQVALPVLEPVIQVRPAVQPVVVVPPDALPDLQLWLRADGGITHDNVGRVSAWADQSGNGNDALQASDAEQPLFVRRALNGRPILRFDGTNDHLALSNLRYQTLGALSGITIFALVRSSSSANQIIVSFDRGAYWHFALKDSQGLQNVGWATAPSTGNVHDLGTPLSYTDGRWHLICAWFQAGASPDKRLFVDGELVASATAHGGNSLGTGVTRFGFIGVGSEASVFNGTRAPLDFLRADLAEVILYHRALPDDERQQVEQYIVDRYTG